ncbi:MAG TPA: phage portal protein [Candidatus Omnitrophota bacterium]|nr:phage portal protein [Candidatus Omnitrophota bacterium]
MGFISKLLGKKQVQYIYFGATHPAPFDRNLYEQETVRAIIDCIASHAAKAEAMHVILDHNGRITEIKHNSPYAKLLNEKPNPLMSGYDLKYRMVTRMQRDTTAYCYIKWNGTQPEMMLPVSARDATAYPVDGGGYALKFSEFDGSEVLLPAEDIVILRKYYCDSEIFGDGNAPIYNTLDMLKSADEGLQSALAVSNKVRGLLKQKQAMLDNDDVRAATARFNERFSEAAKNGGVVGVDSMEDYTPISVTPWAADAEQMKEIRDNLLRYWRINDDVLMSKYNSNSWQAFYESVIEPILIQMTQSFTAACFTPTERAHGNRIYFASDAMVNMPMSSKTQLVAATRELGMFTKNEYRAMFGYAPIEDGDEPLVSLNYVKQSEQSEYQLGKTEEIDGQE